MATAVHGQKQHAYAQLYAAGVRAVVQRVTGAGVTVDGTGIGAIGPGLCVFVGVTASDTPEVAKRMAAKLWHLRILAGEGGAMDRSAADAGAPMLIVSQFTLYGDTSRGRRPSWAAAAPPDHAEPLVDALVDELRRLGCTVATGRFGADMAVALVNDGPVTVLVELDAGPG